MGEIADKVTEKNLDGNITEVLTNSAEYGVINQTEFFDHAVAKESNIAGYYVIAPGDFVYNPRISATAPVGPIRRNTLGIHGVMSPLYTVFRLTDAVDGTYLSHFFKTNGWHGFMKLEGNSGARSDRFSIGDATFFEMPIPVPSSSEQHAIGSFFSRLDDLITLHQRKYDKLVIFKKSMLEKMFPKDGESVPEIRFAGFTDPWEQRKLGEIADKVTEKNLDGNITEVLTNSAEYGVINQTEFFDHAVAKESNIAGYYVIAPGDFVYNPRISATAPVGPIRRNTLGIHGVMSPLYTVFRLTDAVDGTYLSHFFKTNGWHGFMKLEGNSGARSDRFSIGDATFFEMPIPVPSSSEQHAIGSFFSRLDDLITLHQRKYDKLVIFKKSMLEKMFPKDGESVPEIRFAGFTDPWEQRKLGDIAERVTRKNENNESDLPLTISAQHGLIDQRLFFNAQVASRDMSGYYLLRQGEFAYNKSTSADSPWGAIKRLTRYEKGCVSTLYICFALLNANPDYLVTYYETNRWHKAVQMIAAEGARNHGLLNIAPDDFFDTMVSLPESQAEQQTIGAFFSRLDSLITLHQRKLELLQNIKKSLLDKMFV